ncbi:MAG: signal peptidase II [Candidatus Handelsmanbacteria bacterium RIFCSPLOWO2_12_FULL_64_10]|uniref:Lipoprotein signal peptidase n=1 Tax=Handelsmanbacteria sp. (strain RIFCSPLOWO2_12_FULL_64_10) TaxID=1817868 RepID=A0A1F6CCE5_HANXR|nr:MAG: signal peptidase II [Candidatus Handelsmanbacteria bacterium RIFCSPLOWO2_12_FULL_64_10]
MKIWIALLALALDQGSKIAVTGWMQRGESLPVVGDLIRLTYIHNPGAVFGLTFGGRSLHLTLSLLALGLVVAMLRKTPAEERRAHVGLSMILGGAVGNMIDRVRIGEVIDFLDVGVGKFRWYVFNVADAFVTVGVLVLVTAYLFKSHGSQVQSPESQAQGSDPG